MPSFIGMRLAFPSGARAFFLLAIALLATPRAVFGVVNVNVTRVGYPGLGSSGIVRDGAWVPFVVDLELINEPEFFGKVRVGQFDADGDECYDSVDVHLRAETGGTQRVVLFAVTNARLNRSRYYVELFDGDGHAVQVVSQGELTYQPAVAQPPEAITDDDIFVLSVGTGAMGPVQKLVGAESSPRYARGVYVGHISAEELPEHWIGLEIVDRIVWDGAEPEKLTDGQVRALLEWVRQGGTLLIAASRSAATLELSKTLKPVLPVEIGDLRQVDNLPHLRRALVGKPPKDDPVWGDNANWWRAPFPQPVPVAQCTPVEGAQPVAKNTGVIFHRAFGRGRVVFSGVELTDLFSAPGSAAEFYQRVLHLPMLPSIPEVVPDPAYLYSFVDRAVSFSQRAGLYLSVVGLCSIAYVLAGTFGTWSVLAGRGWRKHSWTAFAVVGVAASLLAIVTVNSLRGFGGTSLHQLSVVDLEAGSAHGHATSLFGVKTGMDKRLDLWLPSDPVGAADPGRSNCFLRPLPAGHDSSERTLEFADPVDYRLVPASALIDDVRIRGTLKRLEGRWEGPIDGAVEGAVSVRGDGLATSILDGSYISNELGVDLHDCFLFLAGEAYALGGGPRSDDIFVFPLGDVRAGAGRVDLRSVCYATRKADQKTATFNTERSLTKAHKTWGSPIRALFPEFSFGTSQPADAALGSERSALLLLTTIGEYDEQADVSSAQLWRRSWSRDRFRQLDLTDRLQPDRAVFVGFADDPGPVTLFSRTGDRPFRILRPDPGYAMTMYRVRIPVRYAGKSREEDDEFVQ